MSSQIKPKYAFRSLSCFKSATSKETAVFKPPTMTQHLMEIKIMEENLHVCYSATSMIRLTAEIKEKYVYSQRYSKTNLNQMNLLNLRHKTTQ